MRKVVEHTIWLERYFKLLGGSMDVKMPKGTGANIPGRGKVHKYHFK